MGKVITIGLDIAKHVFQVHGVDAAGTVIVRQKLRRSDLLAFFERTEACLVGIEACATAHYWARSIMALGHRVKLMPQTYVKPYVKRHKYVAADAEAICEAVNWSTLSFLQVMVTEQPCTFLTDLAMVF